MKASGHNEVNANSNRARAQDRLGVGIVTSLLWRQVYHPCRKGGFSDL